MKKFFAIFVLLSLNAVNTQVHNEEDLNRALFHALDVVLRAEMRTGNPYTGFPIIAPASVPQSPVDWRFGHLVDLEGELRNVRVEGLDGFIINESRLSLLTMRFTFDFVWPQVLATGWYNLNGRFGGLIPIFGNGNFRIDPRNFRVRGNTQIRIGVNNGINMTSLEARLNLQTLNLNIEGILGGGDLGAVINLAAQDLIPHFMNTLEDQISAVLSAFILPRLNPYLNNLSLDDIRNLIP